MSPQKYLIMFVTICMVSFGANAVSPVLEYVVDNCDGSFTAHFGYYNPEANDVSVPIGSNNRFSIAPADRGQPTSFEPGRHYDVFTAVFPEGNLVWSLDGRTATAGSGAAQNTCPSVLPVSPVLENVVNNCDGTYTAIFGYSNPNTETVNIPIGPDNGFAGTPQDRGQPVEFLPGRTVGVFRTDFDGSNLVWSLNNRTATASSGQAGNVCRAKIVPVCHGVVDQGDGTFVAWFGYQNRNDTAVTIAVGPQNRLSNGSTEQPTAFEPGVHSGVFSVEFNGPVLEWDLDGSSVVAETSAAFFTRMPQSIIDAGIPPDALQQSLAKTGAGAASIAPLGVEPSILVDIAEQVLAKYPSIEAVLGPNGSLQPIVDDLPGMSEQEVAEHFEDILATYEAAVRYEIQKELQAMAQEPSGLGKISASQPNSEEIKVMLQYPLLIKNTSDAADKATEIVINKFGNSADNGKQNSLRHSLWNALIMSYTGWYWTNADEAAGYARLFTDAHEYGAPQTDPRNSKMDFHNNGAGRLYGRSVATRSYRSTFLFLPRPYVSLPGDASIGDALYQEALNGQYFRVVDQLPCIDPATLVYFDDNDCPASGCVETACTNPPGSATGETYFVKLNGPRVLARAISTVVSVAIPCPPCPCCGPITCAIYYLECKRTLQKTVQSWITPVVEYVWDNPTILLHVGVGTSVTAPATLSATNGTKVSFVRWEGSAAQYLDDPYSSSTTITIPAGVEGVALTPVYK